MRTRAGIATVNLAPLGAALVGALVVGAAVAPSSARAQGDAPLAPFAAQTLTVAPVQFLRADSAAPVHAPEWVKLRLELDDSIGVAIAERGIGKKWTYAADLARMAKRNVGYVSDPYTLGAGALRRRPLKIGDPAPSMLLNNLRSLIALGDSRYAIVPVELAFADSSTGRQMVLRVAVVDGRGGTMVWYTDLTSPAPAKFGSAEIGELAQRVADLVVAR